MQNVFWNIPNVTEYNDDSQLRDLDAWPYKSSSRAFTSETNEFARAVAPEIGSRWQIWRVSWIWKCQDFDRVDLIRERHVRVKDEAKIASGETTGWDDIIAEK